MDYCSIERSYSKKYFVLNLFFLHKIRNSIKGRYKTYSVKSRNRIKSIRKKFVKLGEPQAVIWIFGCQRSGTTFLENVFRHDLDSVVFGEFSELAIAEDKTVLKPNEELKSIVLSKNAKYAVIRPLFESDRMEELLGIFPNSIGIWLYRDSEAVVDSMIRKWDDQFFNISKQNETNADGQWRLNEIAENIRNEYQELYDQYSSYWKFRNMIPFKFPELLNSKLLLINYSDITKNPGIIISGVFNSVGITSNLVKHRPWIIKSRSRSKGKLGSSKIQKECEEIFNRLNQFKFK